MFFVRDTRYAPNGAWINCLNVHKIFKHQINYFETSFNKGPVTSPVLSPTQSAQTVSPVTQSAQTVSPAEIADNSSIPPTNLQPMSPPTHPTTASQPHQPANSSSKSVPVSVTTQETTSQTNTSGNILLSAINDHIQGQGMSNAAEMQT